MYNGARVQALCTLHFFMHEIKAQLDEIKSLIAVGLKKVDLERKKELRN